MEGDTIIRQEESRYTGILRSVARVIDAAKKAVRVIDLADLLCGPVQMHRVGKEWVGRCPLPDHEDRSPSFCVNVEENVWFCHGCLRGGDVVRLACYAWGYEPGGRDEQMAAAQLLHEFGHDIPARPKSWHDKQDRQREAREAYRNARYDAARRRSYKLLLRDLAANMGDPDPSESEREMLWEAAGYIARLLVTDIEERGGGSLP